MEHPCLRCSVTSHCPRLDTAKRWAGLGSPAPPAWAPGTVSPPTAPVSPACAPGFSLSRLLCLQMLCPVIIFSLLCLFFPGTLTSSDLNSPQLDPCSQGRQCRTQLPGGVVFPPQGPLVLWVWSHLQPSGQRASQVCGLGHSPVDISRYLQDPLMCEGRWKGVEMKEGGKRKGRQWEAIPCRALKEGQIKRDF